MKTVKALADQHKVVSKREGLALLIQLSTHKHPSLHLSHSSDLAQLMNLSETHGCFLQGQLSAGSALSSDYPHGYRVRQLLWGGRKPQDCPGLVGGHHDAERWHGLRAAQSARSTSLAPACFPEEGRRNPPNPLHGTCANRYCSGYLRDYRGRVSNAKEAQQLPSLSTAGPRRPVCSSGLAKMDAEGEMAQDLPEKQ